MNCRICYDEISEVKYFCKCKNENAYIHKKCLIKWLQISGNTKCEICNFPYIIKYSNKKRNILLSFMFFCISIIILIGYCLVIFFLKRINITILTLILVILEFIFAYNISKYIKYGIINIYTISNPRAPIFTHDQLQNINSENLIITI